MPAGGRHTMLARRITYATKSEFVLVGGTDVFALWGLCSRRLSSTDHDAIVETMGLLQH